MIDVKRLGHLTLSSPDPSRQAAYYTSALGLDVIESEGGRFVLATRTGLEAIVLEKGDRAGVARLALQVAPGTDLGELSSRLSKQGIASERRRDVTPGVRESVAFQDAEGRQLELYADFSFAPASDADSAIAVRKLGHVAFHTANLEKTVAFYRDVLGFRLSDQRSDFFAFLRCSRDHHTLNFLQAGGHAGVHHMAFELRDEAEINRACDSFSRRNIKLNWGPLRHIIGHNIAIYHKNPDNLTVECFCDLDVMYDEALNYFEPRPWHQDRPQRPKVWGDDTPTNYWGPEFGPGGAGPKSHS
jgi:catechol 2,3-dioxygenase-like lactoylglutathione lyase family enzyme